MMGDRQWPDPHGWEALTQSEAERDAAQGQVDRLRAYAKNGRLAFVPGTPEQYPRASVAVRLLDLEAALDALAVAERERDQARAKCPACGHEWRRHDPADGRCDSFSNEPGYIGVCRCGREVAFTTEANARLSRAALAEEPQT